MYYYKHQTEKELGLLCLDEPLNPIPEGYIELTQEQYEAECAALNPPPPADTAIRRQIGMLKSELSDTDWIICKIAEADTPEEASAMREKYAHQIALRRQIRFEINELEKQLQ